MTPRKFERQKQRGALAKSRARYKAYCKARRELNEPYPTFEQWLGVEAKQDRHRK